MTAFENFINLELPRRGAVLTNAIVTWDDDPNDGGAPTILNAAPIGTQFFEETAQQWWVKNSASAGTWVAVGAGASIPDLNDFINNPGSVIYVDGTSGNDLNPGTLVLPVKTLAAGVALLETIDQTTRPAIMKIARGAYAENLVLESTSLKRVVVETATPFGVTINALVSAQNNENLVYLHICGAYFSNASTLQCPTNTNNFLVTGKASATEDGTDSLVCSRISNCRFSGGLTLNNLNVLMLEDVEIRTAFNIKNCADVSLRAIGTKQLVIYGSITIETVLADPKPFTTDYKTMVRVKDIRTDYGVDLSISCDNGASPTSFIAEGLLSLMVNLVMDGYSSFTYMPTILSTSVLISATLSDNSCISMLGGVPTWIERVVLNDNAYLGIPTNNNLETVTHVSPDSTLDIGTLLLDEFHKNLGHVVRWDYSLRNASNSVVRTGILSLVYNGTSFGNLNEVVHSSIGDSSGVTFSVAYLVNALQLTGTSDSDGWTFAARRYLRD